MYENNLIFHFIKFMRINTPQTEGSAEKGSFSKY